MEEAEAGGISMSWEVSGGGGRSRFGEGVGQCERAHRQQGLRGDLLADGEELRSKQRGALRNPGVAASLSLKGESQREVLYLLHFPHPA